MSKYQTLYAEALKEQLLIAQISTQLPKTHKVKGTPFYRKKQALKELLREVTEVLRELPC